MTAAETKKHKRGKEEASSDEPRSASTNGKPRERMTRRAELATDVVAELDALRVYLDEATELFRLRVGGELAEVKRRILGDVGIDPKHRPPPARVAGSLLVHLRTTRLKNKGRAKDLNKLENLVEDLAELLPE